MNKIDNEERSILEIKGLKKHFHLTKSWFSSDKQYLHAVDGIDLSVNEGETLGIVGESGCGKSTLGNLIMQLLEPTEGKVIYNGTDLTSLKEKEIRGTRKNIQMIFQDPVSSLNPGMKVFDIIAEPLITHEAMSKKELKNKIYNVLTEVGLDKSHAQRYPHEFSGGQKQRICIARAVVLEPKVIVCDEPVSSLDVSIQAQILNLLSNLQKEYNLTYVFIAHGIPAVKHISDRIAVMYLGKVVELTTKQKINTEPRHPYTDGLINAVPIPDPLQRDKEGLNILEGDNPNPINISGGCRFQKRCPYAQEKCKLEEPVLQEVGENHQVACHFPLPIKSVFGEEMNEDEQAKSVQN
ncbi:ATP-binding cassette domain-containing protein [Virgibacillus sp. NKC19-3]|uniref:ABC transporter ATP-binding protein n=1 Tax=Virgibacillus saliphilus TaxID=2831674 RepID=UPI001C9A5F6E|nr:oligopeptide/dipeptide ABC transporter ATP-binding protein [Virgibacillus sp. NKC19-3]MBY7144580.1 ATP-binding cassette domain-containing protein [Virgibacillus sp. NKC19-3]